MSIEHETVVGLREINHNAGKLFRSVGSGGELIVTDHGVPKWRVVPFEKDRRSPWEKLVESGRVRPPRSTAAFLHPRLKTKRSSESLLAELRGEY